MFHYLLRSFLPSSCSSVTTLFSPSVAVGFYNSHVQIYKNKIVFLKTNPTTHSWFLGWHVAFEVTKVLLKTYCAQSRSFTNHRWFSPQLFLFMCQRQWLAVKRLVHWGRTVLYISAIHYHFIFSLWHRKIFPFVFRAPNSKLTWQSEIPSASPLCW